MKLIAQLKLHPTPDQHVALLQTLEVANAACNAMSETAWQTQTFRHFDLHKLCYESSRAAFGLSAQLTVRCLSKVADAYKLDRKVQRAFRPHGSIAYDDRILSWNLHEPSVSIWTVNGRQSMPFVAGARQMDLLRTRKGETDLAYVKGAFYLLAVCDVEEPTLLDVDGTLGVDLGVTNIAVDSDGTTYSGKVVKGVRYRHRRLRTKLQMKGTLGARRRLRHLAGQERRFARHTNHVVAKRLVQAAERTKRQIALEDLKHIQTRVRARKQQRPVLKSWAFAQLQHFVRYKARLCGVPVHLVDPHNTSRTCPACGHCAKENRKTQSHFLCTFCGYAGNADVIAAINIGRRALVSALYCSDASPACGVAPEQSRLL
ncbi:MAG TPA: transposase [Herpetosiphonaceae bacterium]